MAVYKVPQDVEADDKLIGPFSFRQFIYLIVVAGACGIGFFLFQLFPPLVIVVLPVVVFFGALALPLKKDQPMETYLAAVVQFYLKPRKRMWNPDGSQNLVQIIAPKVVEVQRTKNFNEEEAERRLSYLANIVDSRGWAVRGIQDAQQTPGSSMNGDAYYEAQSAQDMLDDTSGVGQAFENRLDQANTLRHQQMVDRIHSQSAAVTAEVVAPPPGVVQQVMPAAPVADPYADLQTPAQAKPYTTQPVQPPDPYAALHEATSQASEKPGDIPPSPDIINLANNSDLSVETIAREANRIHEREKLSKDEVVISLR